MDMVRLIGTEPRLPRIYQEVEYLESNSTNYIQLN